MYTSVTLQAASDADAEDLAVLRMRAMQPSLEHLGRFDPQRARARFLDGFCAAHTRHVLRGGTRVWVGGCSTPCLPKRMRWGCRFVWVRSRTAPPTASTSATASNWPNRQSGTTTTCGHRWPRQTAGAERVEAVRQRLAPANSVPYATRVIAASGQCCAPRRACACRCGATVAPSEQQKLVVKTVGVGRLGGTQSVACTGLAIHHDPHATTPATRIGNASPADATMDGRSSGSVMVNKRRSGDAPQAAAAASSSGPMFLMPVNTNR